MNKKLFVPLLLAAISLSACGTAAPTDDKAATTAPAAATTPVVATLTDVPAGCPSKTTLTVKTSSTSATPFDAKTGVLVVYKANPETAQLAFGDFAFTADDLYSGLGDGSYKVSFGLTNKDKKPVNVGLFTQKATDNGKVTGLGLSTKESLFGFIGDAATVDLKVVSKTYACGTISFDDGYASVKGDFIANVTAK